MQQTISKELESQQNAIQNLTIRLYFPLLNTQRTPCFSPRSRLFCCNLLRQIEYHTHTYVHSPSLSHTHTHWIFHASEGEKTGLDLGVTGPTEAAGSHVWHRNAKKKKKGKKKGNDLTAGWKNRAQTSDLMRRAELLGLRWLFNKNWERLLTERLQCSDIINYRAGHFPSWRPPNRPTQRPYDSKPSTSCFLALHHGRSESQPGSARRLCSVWHTLPTAAQRLTLTFSAGRLVEPPRPGPSLLADLGPRLLRRPLDSCLVSLLEGHRVQNESVFWRTFTKGSHRPSSGRDETLSSIKMFTVGVRSPAISRHLMWKHSKMLNYFFNLW